jgi:UTP-glucose-1-phosphate uridylyltransferase
MDRAIREAQDAGLEEIVIVAHPAHRELLQREAERAARRVVVAEQPVPRGLADAIRIGMQAAGPTPCAVLLPDNLFAPPSPLPRLVALADGAGEHAVLVARMTAAIAHGKGGSAPARVEPLSGDPDVVRVAAVGAKRAKARLEVHADERFDTPIGRYAFQPEALPAIDAIEAELAPGDELDDVPLLARLASERRLLGLLYARPFWDVGNPEGFRAATRRGPD